MADYVKYDRRVDSLVAEFRTHWSPELADLSAERRQEMAQWVHTHPDRAASVVYDRTHTGFRRTVTVQPADLQAAGVSQSFQS